MNQLDLLGQYRQSGTIHPLPALSIADMCSVQKKYLALCDAGEFVASDDRRIFGHLLHPWIAELVTNTAILAAVRKVIGANILVWVSEFNAKAPRTRNFFSWHQDMYYWRHAYPDLSTIPMVTTWLALYPANANNGCMRIIPGSHRQLAPHVEQPSKYNMLTRAQKIDMKVDESLATPVSLEAGEFSLHHPLLYHASDANASDTPRVGLVVRYLAPEIVPPLRPAYAWLVSGEDRSGNWDHVAPPGMATGPEMRQRCINSIQQITGARFK